MSVVDGGVQLDGGLVVANAAGSQALANSLVFCAREIEQGIVSIEKSDTVGHKSSPFSEYAEAKLDVNIHTI